MKTLRLIFIGVILSCAFVIQAQFSLSVNLGVPPPWGPVGYTAVRYYYLPDVEAYYDVRSSMFIYFNGVAWIHRSYLPTRYRNYDLYGGYKVVMSDYRGDSPYTHFREHKMKYGRGYHGKAQRTIGERPGKGNSDRKMSRGNRNENKREDHGKGRNGGSGNNRGDAHGNGKDHGHGGGNDRKK